MPLGSSVAQQTIIDLRFLIVQASARYLAGLEEHEGRRATIMIVNSVPYPLGEPAPRLIFLPDDDLGAQPYALMERSTDVYEVFRTGSDYYVHHVSLEAFVTRICQPDRFERILTDMIDNPSRVREGDGQDND